MRQSNPDNSTACSFPYGSSNASATEQSLEKILVLTPILFIEVLFWSSGKCEHVTQMIVDSKQLASGPGVLPFSKSLRHDHNGGADKPRQRFVPVLESAPQAAQSFTVNFLDELVLQGNDNLEISRVTLPATAAKQLAIDTSRIMTLRRQHEQAAEFGNARCKTYIRAAASHVRRHGNPASFSCIGDNFRLFLVLSRVEYLVGQARRRQQLTQMLGSGH